MIKKKLILLLLLLSGVTVGAGAQTFGVKTNVLSDALLNANVGVEVGLSPRWTLDVSGQYNAWPVEGHKWKHWLVQPELRRWFCDRFAGHFVGAHVFGTQFNVGNLSAMQYFPGVFLPASDGALLKDHRVQGYAAGAGLAYGYAWVLGRHWNLEAEIGAGYAYAWNLDVFECTGCGGATAENRHRNYVGLTKAAINLVYVF